MNLFSFKFSNQHVCNAVHIKIFDCEVRVPLLARLFSRIISVTVPENLNYFIARCAENIHENWCLEKVRLS